jgi:FIMAH domain
LKNNRRALTVPRLLAVSVFAFLAILCVGALPAAASGGGVTVDQSVNGGSSAAFTVGTSQPNELILVSANGWPCSGGQQVTVDGSPATLVASAGGGVDFYGCSGPNSGPNSGGATVFQFVAPTAGTHNVAIVDEGGYDGSGYFNNFAVSLLNASSTGLTSTFTFGPTTPSITTSKPNEFVYATSVVNTGGSPGTMTWSGSPVTPTLLQSNAECCGIDSSIAGLTAPTAGTYSASLSDTAGPYSPEAQVTILVAVPAGVDALFDALQAAVTGVGPGHSLANKVALAKSYFDAGDTANACSTLNGFINEVKAQTGKKITPAQAADFIAQAQAIEALIGC